MLELLPELIRNRWQFNSICKHTVSCNVNLNFNLTTGYSLLVHRSYTANPYNVVGLVLSGMIVRKLFHPQNGLKMRQFGIKLLVLWVQALQENAGDACMELFASAIPYFPPEKTPMGLPTGSAHSVTTPPLSSTGTLCERYGVYSTSAISSSEASGLRKSHPSTSPVKGEL